MFGTDCTVDITEHTLVEEGPGTNKYKVVGTGECTAAAAGYSGGEITVGAFTFTGATDWPR
jgi:hypothetical protein